MIGKKNLNLNIHGSLLHYLQPRRCYYAIAGINLPIKSTTTTIPTRFLGSLSGIPRVLEIRLLFCCCYIRLLCTGTGTCTIPGIPAGIILTY